MSGQCHAFAHALVEHFVDKDLHYAVADIINDAGFHTDAPHVYATDGELLYDVRGSREFWEAEEELAGHDYPGDRGRITELFTWDEVKAHVSGMGYQGADLEAAKTEVEQNAEHYAQSLGFASSLGL